MSKNQGMYYTPKEILDPAAGTGAYLKDAAELLVSNPPYAAQHSVQRTAIAVSQQASFITDGNLPSKARGATRRR